MIRREPQATENQVTRFPTGRKGGGVATKGGCISSPAGRLYGFRRQRRHKKWRPKGRSPRQRSGTIYLPRAEPSTRPGGVSRSRTEPLAPRAKGPAAPSTLAAKPRQPSGILESTAQGQGPAPIPTAPQAPEPSSPTGLVHIKNLPRRAGFYFIPEYPAVRLHLFCRSEYLCH